MSYASPTRETSASYALASERAAFIRRTYLHLGGAIALFVGLEYVFLTQTSLPHTMIGILRKSPYTWLGFLGAFMVSGWLARGFAASGGSTGLQYLGLGLYVLAESIIFIPLLFIARAYSTPDVIPTAALLTLVLFAGLTATAFITRTDFSFLRGILVMGGFIALGLIVCSVIFGFSLGLVFSGFMVALACGAILYDTSKIIRDFPCDRHVAASLELFASIALLFWYILRILMRLNRR